MTSLQPISGNTSTLKPKPKAPPVPAKKSTLSFHQPPPCPTPDYDTLSISSASSFVKPSQKLSGISEVVEMDSLDSFKLNNSLTKTNIPKPPSIYFQKNRLSAQVSNTSIESNDSIDYGRGVNVSIGGYVAKSSPGKFDFLRNNEKRPVGKSISTSLTSELTQTLNRSNLKKRTESMVSTFRQTYIGTTKNITTKIFKKVRLLHYLFSHRLRCIFGGVVVVFICLCHIIFGVGGVS